jgi:cytoskeletal protein CcmA (bactofilin family)
MWNRRKDEEYTPKQAPAPTPSAAPEPIKEGNPMSSLPVRNLEPELARGSSAAIGKSVMVKGQIFSREDLYIDGEVEGAVECQEHRLTVGPNGKVQANMKAREIVLLGTVHGNVDAADKIDIRKDAKLVGDIKTARIVIEDGAYFKGSIDIQKSEALKATAPPPKSAQPVAAHATAAPTPVGAAVSEVKR